MRNEKENRLKNQTLNVLNALLLPTREEAISQLGGQSLLSARAKV
jgi:hypothetical protein